MALPDLIEVLPNPQPAPAVITVPGSKSITNRALVLAALAEGETVLRGALWSEDTQVMVECLQELGYMVNVQPHPEEISNRSITVYGRGPHVPRGGTETQPMELFVGNAGTAARFLTALVCLGSGVYRLAGVPRMHERPQASLFTALRELGYRIDSPNDRLPATIHGAGPRPGRCRVSLRESSQFASALLLGASAGQWVVQIEEDNSEEAPYVTMTSRLIEVFPRQGGEFQVEPDASSGSYFWALDFLLTHAENPRSTPRPVTPQTGTLLAVAHWPASGWQVDERFANYIGMLKTLCRPGSPALPDRALPGGSLEGWLSAVRNASAAAPGGVPRLVISRRTDLADSIMTAIVIAPLLGEPVRFTDLGRLRLQECERVAALRTELTRCGARVVESGDSLTVYPSPLHGAKIETYYDHRMAMCFSVLGAVVPGLHIRNPACVKKTFPDFFQKLAGAAPHGPGLRIRDPVAARDLSRAELFAE